MSEDTWFNVDGMVVASAMDPLELAKSLSKERVVAKIEWYDATPQLVGLTVAFNGELVGTLKKRDRKLKPGPTLQELAERLAEEFKAEVRIGDTLVDRFEGDLLEVEEAEPEEEDQLPFRVVEISDTPASAVPLMAAFEGIDIGELDHVDGRRILMGQLPEHRAGWHFGEVPFVLLSMHGDEFQVQFAKDEHFETVASYNWGMNQLIIAGAKGWEDPDAPDLDRVLGVEDVIEQIFDAVGGDDLEGALAATRLRGPAAVRKFVKALGLTQDVSEYLLGWLPLDLVDEATVHHARGISNAIGRSVDILIDERKEGSKFWETYSKTIQEKPWLVPMAASFEAVVGAGLLVASRKSDQRSGSKLGMLVGAGLMLDSVAELTLAKYTKWREMRRDGQ